MKTRPYPDVPTLVTVGVDGGVVPVRGETGAGVLGGDVCGAAGLAFAGPAGCSAAVAAGAGGFRRNSITLPVPTSTERKLSSVNTWDRMICGVIANTISFSRRSLFS